MHAFQDLQQQVFYSMLDQVYHGPIPLKGTTTEVLSQVQKEYFSLPYVPNTVSKDRVLVQQMTLTSDGYLTYLINLIDNLKYGFPRVAGECNFQLFKNSRVFVHAVASVNWK